MYNKSEYFDIIFAASVMEHFADRDKIVMEVVRLLVPDGYLIFSSPTETRFYELGRKIFGYVRPEDHYFCANEIAFTARKYLKSIEKKYGPPAIPPFLAAYCIYVFQKRLEDTET